jgi:hypothetical protein
MRPFLAAISLVLALISVLAAVVAPIAAILTVRRHAERGEERGVSTMPLVGSVVGFVAILLAPLGSVTARLRWSWLPLAIEATVVTLCWALWLACGRHPTSRRRTRTRARR